MIEKARLIATHRRQIAEEIFWVHVYSDGSVDFMKEAGEGFFGFLRHGKAPRWYKAATGAGSDGAVYKSWPRTQWERERKAR